MQDSLQNMEFHVLQCLHDLQTSLDCLNTSNPAAYEHANVGISAMRQVSPIAGCKNFTPRN